MIHRHRHLDLRSGLRCGRYRSTFTYRYARTALVALAALVAVSVLVAACSGSNPPERETATGEPQRGGTLVIALESETSGFNVALDQWGLSGYMVAQAVFDRLAGYDEDHQLRPYLAESFEHNEDFTEWTIRLRDGVHFHDGTALNAAALKANFEAQIASPVLGQVMRTIERVQVVDDLALRVVMSSPWSSFPHTLTAQPGFVMAPSMIDDPKGSERPVGTGPFVFGEWVRDKTLVVTRNDDYWRQGFPLLDGIEFRVLTEEASRRNSLESGDVDLMETREPSHIVDFEEIAGQGEYELYLDIEGETTEETVFFNLGRPPFDDPLAREAVVRAIDKALLSELVFDGRFPPAEGPFRESSPWYREVDFDDHDPERARELAEEYEQRHGEPLRFSFLVTPDPTASQIGQVLQDMLAPVGIEMELQNVEATQAIVNGLMGDFDAGTIDALWGSQHPDREYTFLHSSNAAPVGSPATAFTRMQNPKVDSGMDAARATDDPVEQADAWGEVVEGIAEDNTFVFLVHDDIGVVAHSYVQDVTRWTFPDGTPGLPQEQTVLSLYQIWLSG